MYFWLAELHFPEFPTCCSAIRGRSGWISWLLWQSLVLYMKDDRDDIDYKDCSSMHFLSKIMILSWHFSFTAIYKFTVSCIKDNVLFITSIGNINKYLLSGGKVHILSNSLLSTYKLEIQKLKALKMRWGLFMLFVQYWCTVIFSVCFCAVIYVQQKLLFLYSLWIQGAVLVYKQLFILIWSD